MKYLLVMNPGSRGGSSLRRFNDIFFQLDRAGIQYDYRITASLEDACIASKEGNKAGYDVIVAVGGDGTLNRVLNGFYDDCGNKLSKAKMGVLYTGTSPDFCKSYGIPTDIAAAVQVLVKGKSKKIRIGKISLAESFDENNDGLPPGGIKALKTRYFACCANIGIGAAIARNANSGIRKLAGDHAGTFIAMMQALTAYKPCEYLIECDGRLEKATNVYNISVGRTAYVASGIKVYNELMDEDRRFYMLSVSNLKLRNLAGVLSKLYSGKSFENDGVVDLSYCEVVEIYGSSANPEVEFDGDPAGFLPCRIEQAAAALDIICRGD